jgi:hypothetical protein
MDVIAQLGKDAAHVLREKSANIFSKAIGLGAKGLSKGLTGAAKVVEKYPKATTGIIGAGAAANHIRKGISGPWQGDQSLGWHAAGMNPHNVGFGEAVKNTFGSPIKSIAAAGNSMFGGDKGPEYVDRPGKSETINSYQDGGNTVDVTRNTRTRVYRPDVERKIQDLMSQVKSDSGSEALRRLGYESGFQAAKMPTAPQVEPAQSEADRMTYGAMPSGLPGFRY